MDCCTEKRREKRLSYRWPVWFAEDLDEMLSQGQMIDISSGGAAFECHNDPMCPYQGQQITARFSVPKYENSKSYEVETFVRNATVCRTEPLNPKQSKIAVKFDEPLDFQPILNHPLYT
jgi:hypothetical protein